MIRYNINGIGKIGDDYYEIRGASAKGVCVRSLGPNIIYRFRFVDHGVLQPLDRHDYLEMKLMGLEDLDFRKMS